MQNNSHGESCGCIIIDFQFRQYPPVTEVKHIACHQNGEFAVPHGCQAWMLASGHTKLQNNSHNFRCGCIIIDFRLR